MVLQQKSNTQTRENTNTDIRVSGPVADSYVIMRGKHRVDVSWLTPDRTRDGSIFEAARFELDEYGKIMWWFLREIATEDIAISVEDVLPVVGQQTTLAAMSESPDFPLQHGNYCYLKGGIYLCNCYAENLTEYRKQHLPPNDTIEVTVLRYLSVPEKVIGFVSDKRLRRWCTDTAHIAGCREARTEDKELLNKLMEAADVIL